MLLWIAGGCFLLIIILAVLVAWIEPSSSIGRTAATTVFAVLVVAVLLWSIFDALPVVITLSLFDTYSYRMRQLEVAHDIHQASELQRFGISSLRFADKLLSLRIERMKLRLGVYVGGSDKVAVFGLVAGAGAIWHNFPRNGWDWEQYLYLFFGALVGGMAAGGMLVNSSIKKLSYQRDLLAIAIHQLTGK